VIQESGGKYTEKKKLGKAPCVHEGHSQTKKRKRKKKKMPRQTSERRRKGTRETRGEKVTCGAKEGPKRNKRMAKSLAAKKCRYKVAKWLISRSPNRKGQGAEKTMKTIGRAKKSKRGGTVEKVSTNKRGNKMGTWDPNTGTRKKEWEAKTTGKKAETWENAQNLSLGQRKGGG